jgi:dCMP deaminase
VICLSTKESKWTYRLLGLAFNPIAQWSKDPSSKVGCVIADHDFRVIATGYNGFATGIKDLTERLEDRETKLKLTIHAEENALLFARGSVVNAVCYVTHPPCSGCSAKLIQAGISRIVTAEPLPEFASRWAKDMSLALRMYDEAGIEFVSLARRADW